MKPLISYYGGKQRMAHNIIPLIPKHTVYVEPFAGGAAIFFLKPWPDVSNADHYREVLNDKNSDLINLYRCFQDKDKAERLIHRLEFTLYSRGEYVTAKEKEEVLDDVERAARFYINIQKSFSNSLSSGWRTSVYSHSLAATWANRINSLKDFFPRLSAVHIEQDDAIAVIKRWDSPQTFFYCDPPYPGANQGHYSGYTTEDFKNLVSSLDECHGSFLLSNYDQTEVTMPQGWERFNFDASSSAAKTSGRDRSKKAESSGPTKRIEAVWRRFNKTPLRDEIQKLYDMGKFDCFASNPNDQQEGFLK